jgi:aspartyl-tRNA(Asn)/glutamyl-tRNA(Gln) amidotransferase subunit B
MFCGCENNYFGQPPNTHTCPVCLALPGALPVPNEEAIRFSIKLGIALHCEINLQSFFERKHYFYPDLPKGYQISQYLKPFAYNGYLDIGSKKIRINRVHLEEDTGKLLHGTQLKNETGSFIDFNRSGVPLVEIVTEADIESGAEASLYLQKLQKIVQYLGISDADMEKGSMRAEPNISVLPLDEWNQHHKLPAYKVEVKNINSFRFVKRAIEFEEERQQTLLERNEKITQETRRYKESTKSTESMRSKEEAKDYRYFPEPDIPPFEFTEEYIHILRKEVEMVELPQVRHDRFLKLGLRTEIAEELVNNKPLGDLFLQLEKGQEAVRLANYLVNQKDNLDLENPDEIIKKFKQTSVVKLVDPQLVEKAIADAIKNNPQAVADYQKGKQSAVQFLLGQVLRVVGRQVNVGDIIVLIKAKLA